MHTLLPAGAASAEGDRSLLKVKQYASGAAIRDAASGQGLDDLVETGEDIVERSHRRETRTEDVGAADGSAYALLSLAVALMVIAELFAELSWGTAGFSVGHREIADGIWQWEPPKRLADLVRQPAAKIVQATANPAAKWDTPRARAAPNEVA